jgi:hypothetical protein
MAAACRARASQHFAGVERRRQVIHHSVVCGRKSRTSQLKTASVPSRIFCQISRIEQGLICPMPDYYWGHPSGRFLSQHDAMASIADRPSMCGYEIQPSRMLSLRRSFDWQPVLEAMLFNGMPISGTDKRPRRRPSRR